ncbi:ankyrin repeat domain-containing protein [Pseudoalteromonas sp. T1lg23B]|uniref:ankyrin repeat domain-containing protein n=1 Tax=Pseudoalteromonas sp. T1lg23B TaxID=2077097 RepID=UPI000CF6B711|nr:ankyrin repeat domain-containing protein [Pseudoalteromonas sp. T1lg23B]
MRFAPYFCVVITILIFSRESLDSNINNDLLLSIKGGNLKQFQQLLSDGADPNYRDEKGDPQNRPVVMEQAAVHENPMFLQLCLEHGANPDILDGYKSSPVILEAAKYSRLANVKLLVKHGANLNAQNKSGNTPLHLAISVKNYNIAHFLVLSGASLKVENKWGYTPVDQLKKFGDAGVKKGSNYYEWYLKFVALVDENNT